VVASVVGFQIDGIEAEFLHANWTSEFSHSLDPNRTSSPVIVLNWVAIPFLSLPWPWSRISSSCGRRRCGWAVSRDGRSREAGGV